MPRRMLIGRSRPPAARARPPHRVARTPRRARRARDRSRSGAMTPSCGFLFVRCGVPEAPRLRTLRLWQGYPVHPRQLLVLWPLSFRGRMVGQSVGQASSGQACGR